MSPYIFSEKNCHETSRCWIIFAVAGDDEGTFLSGVRLGSCLTPAKQRQMALTPVGQRIDRALMFSPEGLAGFFGKIESFLGGEKLPSNEVIEVIRVIVKRIIAVRASALSGVEVKEAPVERAKEAVTPAFEGKIEEVGVPELVEEVKALVSRVAFSDLVSAEGNDYDMLSFVSRELQSVEGVSGATKVLLMKLVGQYLVVLQSEVIEDEEVQKEVNDSYRRKAEKRLESVVNSREFGFDRRSGNYAKSKEYLGYIHEFLVQYNEPLPAVLKVRPDIIDHAWCSHEEHVDALPENFRHTFLYLMYLKMRFRDVESRGDLNNGWKRKFEETNLLKGKEGPALRAALAAYFPNLGRSVGGMLGSMKRLLEKSRSTGERDWLELLIERVGEDFEINEGLSLKDLANG